jgi:hypothetical protein
VQADEQGQGMARGQPLVPGGDPATPLLLQVAQELPYTVRLHVLDGQEIDRLSGAPGESREQQPQGVAVAPCGDPPASGVDGARRASPLPELEVNCDC